VAVVANEIERRHAVAAATHRLAVEQAGARPERAHSLYDQREAEAPIDAIAGQQPHAGGAAARHQPQAVKLDLVQPTGTVGRSLGRRWKAGFDEAGRRQAVRNMRK